MKEVIQYEQLASFLEKASLFEIYRISIAIDRELDNPERIALVKTKFRAGDVVEYFSQDTNTLTSARVLAKNPKTVSVEDCKDGRRWKLPYYLLNIDSREFDFSSSKKGLNRNTVKVGDFVGFNKDGQEIVGRVERLNHKTVSLVTNTDHRWRVAYGFLYTVIDGDCHQLNLIESEVL